NTATQPELFGRFGLPMLESFNDNSSDAISMYNEHLRPGTVNANRATGFSPLQAVTGIQQMRDLDHMQARRRSIAEKIREALPTHMVPQLLAPGDRHAWYFVVATTNNPDDVVQRLLAQGIDAGRYLMRNCAGIDEPALAATYKGAEYLYQHSIQLPAYPTLCDAGLEQLLVALRGLA
ncbi:MAG TPA: hypothetical protein EYN66_11345, partial [Myxococcales bacterium]|nr:hypothetical protein [Myxococcales bacterium]